MVRNASNNAVVNTPRPSSSQAFSLEPHAARWICEAWLVQRGSSILRASLIPAKKVGRRSVLLMSQGMSNRISALRAILEVVFSGSSARLPEAE